MKQIGTMALLLVMGAGTTYAQLRPLKMTFSGTGGPSAVNLNYANTNTSEDNAAGHGTFGQFTFRNVRAIRTFPQPSNTCTGPTKVYFASEGGAGVFRFHDGSLLKVKLLEAGDCIDFAILQARCTMTFQIAGGTGRFRNASGNITLTETVVPVLSDAFNHPTFFAAEGEMTGTISGVGGGPEPD